MAHHHGELGFQSSRQSVHQTTELVVPPILTAIETDAAIQQEDKDKEALELASVEFHPPSLVEDECFYVDFRDGDERDPVNFSPSEKWVMTIIACTFAGTAGAAASSYAMGYTSMMRDLNCTLLQATMGLSLYALGVGLAPLVTSSLSEEFGRLLFYIISSLMFMLTQVVIAMAQNIQIVIVARFFEGAFASTGSTLVAGTISDIWRPHQRGLPMSLYSIGIFASIGLGPAIAGWIEANPSLEWRWIQWVHVIISGVYCISLILFMKETRSAVILARIARKVRKDTGDSRYRARTEVNKPNLASMIKVSCTRPLYLLLTEPTVQSFSLWVGFVWGVLYILIDSVSGEFQSVYRLGVGETGTAFVTVTIGSLIGYAANVYQEKLYHKYVDRKGQEARLYIACVGSVILPTGMLIFAWTARPDIFWIFPLIGLTLFMASAFVIYQVVFVYLADW